MNRTAEIAPTAALARALNLLYPAILAVVVAILRIAFRGPLYFGDGPAEVQSIVAKTYIIQPPGYWLYIRIAGMFPDPVLAMTTMNILFSVAGVVVFYFAACFFTGRQNAFIAALAYSSIFYIWFSGEVHSTYASQILFPVAIFYVLLRYDRDKAKWLLWLAALLFAVGAGLRPTDGAFMAPLLVYFAAYRMKRREGIGLLAAAAVLCLAWVIPTYLAYRQTATGTHKVVKYLSEITTIQSVFSGIHLYTIANVVRYALPLVLALWPILGMAIFHAIRERRDWRVRALLVWIIPGSLFFLLILISNAPYLNFLTAAFVLLAVSARRMLMVTAVWNAIIFLCFAPVPSQKLAINIVNSFVMRCTWGGIQQRYNVTLSEMQNTSNRE